MSNFTENPKPCPDNLCYNSRLSKKPLLNKYTYLFTNTLAEGLCIILKEALSGRVVQAQGDPAETRFKPGEGRRLGKPCALPRDALLRGFTSHQ